MLQDLLNKAQKAGTSVLEQKRLGDFLRSIPQTVCLGGEDGEDRWRVKGLTGAAAGETEYATGDPALWRAIAFALPEAQDGEPSMVGEFRKELGDPDLHTLFSHYAHCLNGVRLPSNGVCGVWIGADLRSQDGVYRFNGQVVSESAAWQHLSLECSCKRIIPRLQAALDNPLQVDPEIVERLQPLFSAPITINAKLSPSRIPLVYGETAQYMEVSFAGGVARASWSSQRFGGGKHTPLDMDEACLTLEKWSARSQAFPRNYNGLLGNGGDPEELASAKKLQAQIAVELGAYNLPKSTMQEIFGMSEGYSSVEEFAATQGRQIFMRMLELTGSNPGLAPHWEVHYQKEKERFMGWLEKVGVRDIAEAAADAGEPVSWRNSNWRCGKFVCQDRFGEPLFFGCSPGLERDTWRAELEEHLVSNLSARPAQELDALEELHLPSNMDDTGNPGLVR